MTSIPTINGPHNRDDSFDVFNGKITVEAKRTLVKYTRDDDENTTIG